MLADSRLEEENEEEHDTAGYRKQNCLTIDREVQTDVPCVSHRLQIVEQLSDGAKAGQALSRPQIHNFEHLRHFEYQAGEDDTITEYLGRQVLEAMIFVVKELFPLETILAEEAIDKLILLRRRFLFLSDSNVGLGHLISFRGLGHFFCVRGLGS